MADNNKKAPRGANKSTTSKKKSSGGSLFKRINRGAGTISKKFMDNMRNGRLTIVFGFLIGFLTISSLLAMTSFLFTGGQDQNLINAAIDAEGLEQSEQKVRNALGIIGARWSDTLFNDLFGWGSFILMGFLLYLTYFLLWHHRKGGLHLLKVFVQMAFGAIWISVFAASIQRLFSSDSYLLWGGEQGAMLVRTILRNFDTLGLVVLLVVSLLVGLVLMSDRVFAAVKEPRMPDVDAIPRPKKEWLERLAFWRNLNVETSDEEEAEPSEVAEHPVSQTSDREGHHRVEEVEEELVVPIVNRPTAPEPVLSVESPSGLIIEEAPKDDLVEVPRRPEHLAPGLQFEHYHRPSIEMLREHEQGAKAQSLDEIEYNKQRIIDTLASFKMRVTPYKATIGPTVTLYEVIPDQGIKVSRIKTMEDDIAMGLKSEGVRIIAPMPGKGTVGIEVPNSTPQTVSMRTILASRRYNDLVDEMALPIGIGKTITNEPFVFDLAKMPHMLIAGATGQGKSVGLNAMITSLLYSRRPEELKFVLVDPKMLEFSVYAPLERHFMAKLPDAQDAIITDMSKVVPTLNSLCVEMDNRYRLLTQAKVRNIKEYNAQVKANINVALHAGELMPYIVLIVDEFADLIMTSGKEVEQPIARLAQKARAAGIHMVIATQRPSTDVITGLIKANFPARIAFKVFSMVDSRTILDSPGANQLVGRGDMLFYQGKEMVRIQCAFLDTPETEQIVSHICAQEGPAAAYQLPEYVPEGDAEGKSFDPNQKDSLFDEVARLVVNSQVGSTSNIQRKFNIGYNRAGRLMDQLEGAGIVSPPDGSKPREVYIKDIASLEHLLDQLR
ncbi:MAG: DNA translocase FtsK 4TM domain-containing protein [Porphyromonadaceae bacterium]|nr:DNA translocase FtsK 4TM domain-containing protein [Porphyromonadaceae bacterium]